VEGGEGADEVSAEAGEGREEEGGEEEWPAVKEVKRPRAQRKHTEAGALERCIGA
jgi:hypothetical protein